MTQGAGSGFGLDVSPLDPREPAAKALGVLSSAFRAGGETAQETLRIQTKALELSLKHNAELTDRVVRMADVVSESAKNSVNMAKVSAERDIELAKIKTDAEFYGKIESLAVGPIGQQILGRFLSGGLEPEKKKALGNVLTRFISNAEVCSAVQAANPEEYAAFLEFAKTLI